MSEREWFHGGASHFIRDVMLLLIGMDLLGMVVRGLATPTYSSRLAWIAVWATVYGAAYLFRRRGPQ